MQLNWGYNMDETAAYEEELRWRLEVLKTHVEEGKIKFAPEVFEKMKDSLGRVRYGADGQINLSTVDGSVRAIAMASAHLQNRQDAKEAISLHDISQLFVEIIDQNFGFLQKEARDRNLNVHEFASLVSTSSQFVDDFAPRIPDFLDHLDEFWEAMSESATFHIQDLSGIKGVFGGDLFPSHERNIASAVGLYIDTIVLNDPFSHSRAIFENVEPERKVYFLIKHALNILQYRELAAANISQPIVVFIPSQAQTNEEEREFLLRSATPDAVKHANRLFGRDFQDSEDVLDFFSGIDTTAKLIDELVDSSRLLFDAEWSDSIEAQVNRALAGDYGNILGSDNPHPGSIVANLCFGRMGQATDILLKSRYLCGVPLIDAPTSWEYFNWKLEYNSAQANEGEKQNLHMAQGLQRAASTDEEWLGAIPPAALIEMRQEGAFEQIRNVLSQGVDELANIKPTNFFRTSDQIVDNIREAYDVHQAEVRNLTKMKVKFAGHDIGSMLTAGTLDVASIITGTGTFGAASLAVNQLLDVPKLRDIPERFRELRNAHVELRKSPMGLLFKNKPRK